MFDALKQSESIDQLAAALAIAQGEIQDAPKDAVNPHFRSRYATLASIRSAIQGPFSKNGLAVTQLPTSVGSDLGLITMLLHKSGQWLCGVTRLVGRLDQPQSVGSAITYARRYGLSAIAGIASDDDDDGNAAQSSPPRHANGRGDDHRPHPQVSRTAVEPEVAPPIGGATKPVRSIEDLVSSAAEYAGVGPMDIIMFTMTELGELFNGESGGSKRDIREVYAEDPVRVQRTITKVAKNLKAEHAAEQQAGA